MRQAESVNGTLVSRAASLTSGTTPAGRYLVREAGPLDSDLIGAFISGLSVQSQYFRFFTAVAPPSAGLLRALCDSSRADLLVITDAWGAVVGHGMAADARTCAPSSADFGLAIADAWQGQGLGTMLLRLLMARAARRGVRSLQFEVLADNARMLGIIDRRFPGAARTRTADSISIRADITAWYQPPAGGENHGAPPSVARARGICPADYQGGPHESRPHAA